MKCDSEAGHVVKRRVFKTQAGTEETQAELVDNSQAKTGKSGTKLHMTTAMRYECDGNLTGKTSGKNGVAIYRIQHIGAVIAALLKSTRNVELVFPGRSPFTSVQRRFYSSLPAAKVQLSLQLRPPLLQDVPLRRAPWKLFRIILGITALMFFSFYMLD
ncbi:hypothetical protein MRX96_027560 [Rhipicephalus microplus]